MATATNHFHAIDPQGVAHTRSTKRTYSHTVVVRLGDAYAARMLANSLKHTAAQAPKDYAFHQSVIDRSWHYIDGKVGGTLRYPNSTSEADMLADTAKHTAELDGRTVEQYTADALDAVRKSHAEDAAKGYFSNFINVGWCGRLDLAMKLANGGHRYTNPQNVIVLEAVAGKPPKAVR